MPFKYSPNYNLKLADSTDTDIYQLDWTTEQAGSQATSNMMIIDKTMKETANKVENLEKTPSTIYAEATKQNSTNYIATVTGLSAYVNNMIVVISLNESVSGVTTLKINDLDAVYIKKYDSSSNLIDITSGQLRSGTNYTLRYNGSYFVLQTPVDAVDIHTNGTSGNFTSINSNGVIADSGKKSSDFEGALNGNELKSTVVNADSFPIIDSENNNSTKKFTWEKIKSSLKTYFDGLYETAHNVYKNAGAHNSIYRGKNLGTEVTAAQYAAIADGSFEDMYVGDYWVIGGVTYRIAAFDYYLRCGDTDLATHHVTVVPDNSLYTHVMNDTNVTTGGYYGSKMYTTGLTQAKTTINTAFGAAHILTHRQLLTNAVANGIPSGVAWYDSTVELMNEQNVYGGKHFSPVSNGSTVPYTHSVDKSQYPLFAFRPDLIANRDTFWLRDVVTAAYFAYVLNGGNADCGNASGAIGVRPAFSIKS